MRQLSRGFLIVVTVFLIFIWGYLSQAEVIYSEDFESTGASDGNYVANWPNTAFPSVVGLLLNPNETTYWMSPLRPDILGEVFGVLYDTGTTTANLSANFEDNATYKLSFTNFRRTDVTGLPVTAAILYNDTVLASETFPAVTTTNTFETRVLEFTSNGGLEVGQAIQIRFSTAGSGYMEEAGIDNIKLEKVSASTPGTSIAQSQNATGYTVSATDLLATNLDSMDDALTINVGENSYHAGGFDSSILVDGQYNDADLDGYGYGVNADGSLAIQGGTITYNLDTTTATNGYKITSIKTYSGWDNVGRIDQSYTVSYATVDNPGTFVEIATVSQDGTSGTCEEVIISSTNVLATGVKSIRFDFGDGNISQQNNGVGYKELDVIGTPLAGGGGGGSEFNIPEMWTEFQPAILSDPLEIEWLTGTYEDGVNIWQVRYKVGTLTGTQTSGTPIMAAYYAWPTNAQNVPGIVHIHGGGQKANKAIAKNWAQQGYACISINWGQEELEPGFANTEWDGLAAGSIMYLFHQWTDPAVYTDGSTLYAEPNPMNSTWMLIAYAARRAITFLTNQPVVDGTKIGISGHSMGAAVTVHTAIDPRVTCITPSSGGTGFLTEDLWGLPGSANCKPPAEGLDLYNATIEHKNYWPLITAPTLFLEATNDFNAPFETVPKSLNLLPEGVPNVMALSMHKDHYFDSISYASRILWQKAHLTGTFDFPETAKAQLDLTQASGTPVFTVIPDTSTANTLVSVDIYYSIGRDPKERFWRHAAALENNGVWTAECPVLDLEEMLIATAVVTYDCGFDVHLPAGYIPLTTSKFSIASEVGIAYPPELVNNGIIPTETAGKLLIDDFSRGFQDWSAYENGPYVWSYLTHKVADPSWIGLNGTELALDITTTAANNNVVIDLIKGWHSRAETKYTALVNLPLAGTNSVSVPSGMFVNGNGEVLTSWSEITQLQLGSHMVYPFWQGEYPVLSNLRWTAETIPTYPLDGQIIQRNINGGDTAITITGEVDANLPNPAVFYRFTPEGEVPGDWLLATPVNGKFSAALNCPTGWHTLDYFLIINGQFASIKTIGFGVR